MNNLPLYLKFTAGVLLYVLWGALVFTGHSSAEALVTAIAGGIAGLGVHGAISPRPAEPPTKTAAAPSTITKS